MPQPRFDRQYHRLSERLLRAGVAPRHVRRYLRELSDHFDDLVREEIAGGAARELAETRALARLGNDEDLAQAMLSRPELRSLTARFPWAVFGLGPILLLLLSLFGGLYLEVWLINHTGWLMRGLSLTPGPVAARLATRIYTAYNTLIVFGGPLLFAWLFAWLGARQRMRAGWIVTGVVLICVLGGLQNLIFYDTGCRGCGVLVIQSGLLSGIAWWGRGLHYAAAGAFAPFPWAEGLVRVAVNLLIAGGAWWLSTKRKTSTAIELNVAHM